jgi:hypothetical protein
MYFNPSFSKQSPWVWETSDFYKSITSKVLKIPDPAVLPNTDIKAPYVLIGDEAYPLLPFLLKR